MHVVDFSDVIRPKIAKYLPLQTQANDIALCGDYVGIVQNGATPSENGTLVIYDRYSRVSGRWNKMFNIAGIWKCYMGSLMKPIIVKYSTLQVYGSVIWVPYEPYYRNTDLSVLQKLVAFHYSMRFPMLFFSPESVHLASD